MGTSRLLSNHKIAVIGAGNMGRAIIGGLLKGNDADAGQISASRRSERALKALEEQFPGIKTSSDNVETVKDATIVILAVKPQMVIKVIKEIKAAITEETLIISVLAGITTQTLQERFELNLPVVRTMPNTPALVDEGATAICAGDFASEEDLNSARAVFEAVGSVEAVPEYLMDAITGLSGSGPAYIYMIIEALTDAGVKQGIPRTIAASLSAQTVLGAAKLVIETGKHPAILKDEVTTPGGTTISAIAELESHGLRNMLIHAVATATARSKELSEVKEN
ncbi:MAG: pyrroline-5-carboxylate reductase [Rhodothermales bacterium]